jgi:glycosyltransferase involved in cell wall biosynthesis
LPKRTIIYAGELGLPDGTATAQRVLSNAKLLRELGYTVVFVTKSAEASSPAQITVDGFEARVTPFRQGRAGLMEYLTSVRDVMEALADEGPERVAAVVCYNYPAVALMRLQNRLRRAGIPMIADVTEWYLPRDRRILYRWLMKGDTALRMFCAHRRCSGLIAVSKFLVDYYGGRAMPVVNVPVLTDADDPKWQRGETREDRPLRFVYAGTPFVPRGFAKDRIDVLVETLVEFMREGYAFELSIVGSSEEQYLARYPHHRQIVRDMDGVLHIRGRVSHEEAIAMLRESDFSVFFRDSNRATLAGFPTKFTEAITAGIPVITNKSSNIEEYFDRLRCGILLDDAEPESIRRGFESAFGMPHSEIEAMKMRCQTSRAFDYRAFETDMRVFLDQVANRVASGTRGAAPRTQ